jgi:perosamine synthetase
MIGQMEPWFDADEKLALADYMESGGWLTEHTKTAELEAAIASYVGSKHCVMMPSGTLALYAMLKVLGIGPGDEVIVPDFTMVATANAVSMVGADVVLVDVDRETLCLDLALAERHITEKTKAMIVVSLNGRAPNMERALRMARRKRIYLLEDAAQALGSRQVGKHLGTFGLMGVFSFSAPKVITTGQGGCVVTDDEELYMRLKRFKNFGRTKSGVDEWNEFGVNLKFTDLQAVIGLAQMKKLLWRVCRKRTMFRLYHRLLAGKPIKFLPISDEQTPWFIDILLSGEATRTDLMAYLREHRIGTRPFYPALHTSSMYKAPLYRFPISRSVARNGLWLPSSGFLSDVAIHEVCGRIKSFFDRS